MTKRQAAKSRRKSTDEERRRMRSIRRRIEQEKPEIFAKGRALKRAHDEALVQLKETFRLLHVERKAQGLSLAELRDRCGIGRSALSRLENDPRTNPTIATLTRIADALGKRIVVRLEDKAGSK